MHVMGPGISGTMNIWLDQEKWSRRTAATRTPRCRRFPVQGWPCRSIDPVITFNANTCNGCAGEWFRPSRRAHAGLSLVGAHIIFNPTLNQSLQPLINQSPMNYDVPDADDIASGGAYSAALDERGRCAVGLVLGKPIQRGSRD